MPKYSIIANGNIIGTVISVNAPTIEINQIFEVGSKAKVTDNSYSYRVDHPECNANLFGSIVTIVSKSFISTATSITGKPRTYEMTVVRDKSNDCHVVLTQSLKELESQ